MITLRCPWETPPLRSNQRHPLGDESRKLTKNGPPTIGAMTATTRRRHDPDLVTMGPVVITMIWEVTDKRRRDVGAMAPTLKAWIDGHGRWRVTRR